MLFRKTLLGIAVVLVAGCSDSQNASDSQARSEKPAKAPYSEDASQTSPKNKQIQSEDRTDSEHQKDEDNAAPVRSAETHSHGDAELAVVLENGAVTIELDSPLYNILGFEHEPETETQKASVNRAETQLGRGNELFGFNAGAGCSFKPNGQDIHLFGAETEHEADHDDEHEDDHAEEETHADEHDEDTHKDLILRYDFLCQNPSSLSNISINLFEFFEELAEIDVTYLGPRAQKQETLTRKNMQMDIAQ